MIMIYPELAQVVSVLICAILDVANSNRCGESNYTY